MAVLHLQRWNIAIGDGQPLVVIAGLNVLEDLDLALKAGRDLKAICADLGLPYVFKASFDKANRSSINSYRGPGLEEGLEMLAEVKAEFDVPICHRHARDRPGRAGGRGRRHGADPGLPLPPDRPGDRRGAGDAGAPAAAARQEGPVPGALGLPEHHRQDPRGGRPATSTILCERGVSFGYNNLVVDMLGIQEMKDLGVPVTIDATHAVQLPGADPRTNGASTGGRREGVPMIAKAAVAAGADGVFLEFHPDPDKALCDGPSCLPLDGARGLLATLKAVHAAVRV